MQIRGSREKTNTPYEDLQVEGYFKTQFVYRLLSEDLMERLGRIPLNGGAPAANRGGGNGGEADAFEELCRRLEAATGADPALIRKTLRGFIEKGYIKSWSDGSRLTWHWTHNNRTDHERAVPVLSTGSRLRMAAHNPNRNAFDAGAKDS